MLMKKEVVSVAFLVAFPFCIHLVGEQLLGLGLDLVYFERDMRRTKIHYHEKHNGLVLKSRLVSNITVQLRLTLPCSLMPSYWVKNKLSKTDVTSILDALPSRDVWLLGLATGAVTLAPSSFRTAYSNVEDILITSKASVIRKILRK